MLPVYFGPWQTVYGWFRELTRRFLFQAIHDVTLMLDREAGPTAGVIDSQSIKAPHGQTRGYDAGKKIVGRKRHIAVDTDGRLLMVHLTSADISDSAGGQLILDGLSQALTLGQTPVRRQGCDRLKLMDKAAYLDFTVEIIRRSDNQKGFHVLPRRRAVLRLDDPLATPRARLRSPHRRLQGHDPRRHGGQSATKNHSPVSFQTL